MIVSEAILYCSVGFLLYIITETYARAGGIVLPRHLKFSELVPVHKNILRVDSFRTNSNYQKTPLSQYSVTFATTPGAVYEAIAHTEYINHGSQPSGEIDLSLEVSGRSVARSTTTGNPISQISRTIVGEFTATSTSTQLQAFIVSDIVRTISIYPGYLRVMRIR